MSPAVAGVDDVGETGYHLGKTVVVLQGDFDTDGELAVHLTGHVDDRMEGFFVAV